MVSINRRTWLTGLLVPLAEQRLVSVSVSLTTLDDELKRIMEPRTASPGARLRAMRSLHEAGVPVAAGLAAGAGTRAVWVRFRRAMPRNAVPMTPGELVGSRVRVLWWKDGRGEVVALARGHQATLPARSEEPHRYDEAPVVGIAALHRLRHAAGLAGPRPPRDRAVPRAGRGARGRGA
mgnify:CR=1 FL=1